MGVVQHIYIFKFEKWAWPILLKSKFISKFKLKFISKLAMWAWLYLLELKFVLKFTIWEWSNLLKLKFILKVAMRPWLILFKLKFIWKSAIKAWLNSFKIKFLMWVCFNLLKFKFITKNTYNLPRRSLTIALSSEIWWNKVGNRKKKKLLISSSISNFLQKHLEKCLSKERFPRLFT